MSIDTTKPISRVTYNGEEIPINSLVVPTETMNIIKNGTYDVSGYATAEVNVQPNLIEKEVTENGTYNASNDSADGYSSVVVNIPSEKGSPIEVSSDSDMEAALTQNNVGKVYKFTGTSTTYETNAIYIISEVE